MIHVLSYCLKVSGLERFHISALYAERPGTWLMACLVIDRSCEINLELGWEYYVVCIDVILIQSNLIMRK